MGLVIDNLLQIQYRLKNITKMLTNVRYNNVCF